MVKEGRACNYSVVWRHNDRRKDDISLPSGSIQSGATVTWHSTFNKI